MKRVKSILAVILATIMLFGMVPTSAFATEVVNYDDADEAVSEEVTMTSEEQETEATVEDVSQETEAVSEQEAEPADPEEEQDTAPVSDENTESAADETTAAAVEEPAGAVDAPVTLEVKGNDYTVTATFDATAGFPADVQMKVEEIRETAEDYTTYRDKALEAVQKESEKEVELTFARFFDITFFNEEGEVQPTGAVNISIKYDEAIEVESKEDVSVLHFEDEKAEEPKPVEVKPEDINDQVDEISFATDSFSVYAVIGTGEVARMTVNFYGADGNIVHTMYVKKSDTADELDKIIFDPGAGTLEDGFAFFGWSVDDRKKADGTYYTDPKENVGNAYTVDTPSKTIADVRTYIKEQTSADTFTDGDILDIYAMAFTHYTVLYVDANGTTLGSEGAKVRNKGVDSVEYTVNMGYTTDDSHKFEGWRPTEGAGNITVPAGSSAETLFKNGREIQIKGDVTFSVLAPPGSWLVFDENGSDATYNAPRFYKSGEVTSDAELLPMVRKGYEFRGWYTDKECTDGNEFSFGHTITERTTIYAKWVAVPTAPYIVLIWNENLSGGYDFKKAITVTDAEVGSTIDAVTQQGSGDNAYARINGTDYEYEGFHLKSFDTGKTVAPEGNTVVNVYYDRTEYTLTFQTYQRVGGIFIPRYAWVAVKTIIAKYGASISDQFPIPGYEGRMWNPQGSSIYNEVLVYIDIMPAENVTFHLIDGQRVGNKVIYYYKEALPGENADTTYNGMDFVLYKELECSYYNFFTEAEDYIELNGFYKGGANGEFPPQAYRYRSTAGEFSNPQDSIWRNQYANYVLCYYTRKAYPITYMDGVYVDGNNNPIEEQASQGLLKTSDDITYAADISSYNKEVDGEAGENYYAPTTDGFVFEGWYIDSACTQPYTFTTMPEGGITVYAKWRQIQYRVFLHPNVPISDNTLDWGSDDQAMNFRISNGSGISLPTGRRNGYEFFGWYTDPELTDPHKEGLKLNESTVTTPYDKTVDMTDKMTIWGGFDPNVTPFNADVDRDWITKKYDLYAKWSKVLTGAQGIGVIYDAAPGTGAPSDRSLYKDNSRAVAGAAPTPPAGTNKVFKNWVVQRWDGSKWVDDEVVLPGGSFTVLADNARITDGNQNVVDPAAVTEGNEYFYTVQLRAEYADIEEATPTHIPWYKNDGNPAFRIDTIPDGQTTSTLEINEKVDIQEAPTREGYTFLGWAKVEMGSTADEVTTWENTKANWTQTLTKANLFLYYNAVNDSFYTDSNFNNAVEYVAADEHTPYHALFAVWEETPVYYVYHSSDGTLEELYVPQPREELPDLTDLVHDGYLYGGYYHTDAYEDNKTDYSKGDPYTESGMSLTPTANTVYYLKEVDQNYLKPQAYVVFNPESKEVQDLYGFVNVDDAEDYKDCGLIVQDGERYSYEKDPGLGSLFKSVVFTRNGQTYSTIDRKNFGVPFKSETDEESPVWIGGIKLSDIIVGGELITFSGYYDTQDNVRVTGSKVRAIQFAEGEPPTFTGWTSNGGNTLTGIISQEPDYEEIITSEGNSAGVTTMNRRNVLTIAAPADPINYTISKVYDAETETQTVEGGNQVGLVTYTERAGYVFAGWYQDEALTIPADFSNIQADMTVYARYISSSDISLSFSRNKVSGANVVFNVTASVKNIGDFKEVNVICSKDGSETEDALKTKSTKKSGSGKNRTYTYCYKGTATVQGLSRGSGFDATICWITPDGTKVTGETYSCVYWLGFVLVR